MAGKWLVAPPGRGTSTSEGALLERSPGSYPSPSARRGAPPLFFFFGTGRRSPGWLPRAPQAAGFLTARSHGSPARCGGLGSFCLRSHRPGRACAVLAKRGGWGTERWLSDTHDRAVASSLLRSLELRDLLWAPGPPEMAWSSWLASS